MKDNLLFYSKNMNRTCISCKKTFHTVAECPLIHFSKSRSQLIAKTNYSEQYKGDRLYKRLKWDVYSHKFAQLEKIRIQLKQYRIEAYKEGLEIEKRRNYSPQNSSDEDSFDENALDTGLDDKDFFLKYSVVKYEEGQFVLVESKEEDDLIAEELENL